MSWVAGIDGCRAGWVVVLLQRKGKKYKHEVRLCRNFAEVLALAPQPEVIAIDIPIGLLDKPQPGGRECDRQARKRLGRRASSIFPPPTRPMLKATRYEQVRTQGLSIQSFNILPKIREVDQLMTPKLQTRIHEAAPELAFMALAGTLMQYNKKTQEGRKERLAVLQAWIGSISFLSEIPFLRSQVAPDDVLDACILAWTALQISNGKATQMPTNPPTDARGLKMEIWS
jgi:predicted RNase H-like nuclease